MWTFFCKVFGNQGITKSSLFENVVSEKKHGGTPIYLNPIALRKVKIVDYFGLSECIRVKYLDAATLFEVDS